MSVCRKFFGPNKQSNVDQNDTGDYGGEVLAFPYGNEESEAKQLNQKEKADPNTSKHLKWKRSVEKVSANMLLGAHVSIPFYSFFCNTVTCIDI